MKVLMINGSPHSEGSTYTALCEVAEQLKKNGIESEIFQVGTKPLNGCIACGKCSNGRCTINDCVNVALEKMESCDGLVVGSPVHYASAGGAVTSFLDRFFYAGNCFALKPATAVAVARRAGTTATLDQLNKYFAISNMPIVPSQYWNLVHGACPEDVKKDLEGMQTMRTLGDNMAWLLKSIEAGKNAGVTPPEREPKVRTNFIR